MDSWSAEQLACMEKSGGNSAMNAFLERYGCAKETPARSWKSSVCERARESEGGAKAREREATRTPARRAVGLHAAPLARKPEARRADTQPPQTASVVVWCVCAP